MGIEDREKVKALSASEVAALLAGKPNGSVMFTDCRSPDEICPWTIGQEPLFKNGGLCAQEAQRKS